MDLTEDMPITSENITEISSLALQQVNYEKSIEETELALKQLKKSHRKIKTDLLPEAMAKCGMKKFTLDSGESIDIKEGLSMSAPKAEAKVKAMNDWLIEAGQEALLKSQIILAYDKGEHEEFLDVIQLLDANSINEYKITEGFNTASVKAVLKELMEDGKDVPLEIFGAYSYKESEITS